MLIVFEGIRDAESLRKLLCKCAVLLSRVKAMQPFTQGEALIILVKHVRYPRRTYSGKKREEKTRPAKMEEAASIFMSLIKGKYIIPSKTFVDPKTKKQIRYYNVHHIRLNECTSMAWYKSMERKMKYKESMQAVQPDEKMCRGLLRLYSLWGDQAFDYRMASGLLRTMYKITKDHSIPLQERERIQKFISAYTGSLGSSGLSFEERHEKFLTLWNMMIRNNMLVKEMVKKPGSKLLQWTGKYKINKSHVIRCKYSIDDNI